MFFYRSKKDQNKTERLYKIAKKTRHVFERYHSNKNIDSCLKKTEKKKEKDKVRSERIMYYIIDISLTQKLTYGGEKSTI
jgi:Mg2+ and Co2+ transporter CorA